MGNHDAQIEDNHIYFHELMGTIGYMKEDLQKLVNMNQSSHFQESPIKDQPMEEASVVQLVKDPKGNRQEQFKFKWYFMFFCILVLGVYVHLYPSRGDRGIFWHSCRFKSIVSSTNNSIFLGKNSMICRSQTSYFVCLIVSSLFT